MDLANKNLTIDLTGKNYKEFLAAIQNYKLSALNEFSLILDKSICILDQANQVFSFFKICIHHEINKCKIIIPEDANVKFTSIHQILNNLSSKVQKEIIFKGWDINNKDIELIFLKFSHLEVIDLSNNIIEYIQEEFSIEIDEEFKIKFIHFNN